MAQYTPADLSGEWEFKFLRSASNEFKHSDRLRAYLDEEAQAGWVLLEKFDNARLRLKRPVAARANDSGLSFDPYRTSVGMSEGARLAMVLGIIFGVLALVGVIAAMFARQGP